MAGEWLKFECNLPEKPEVLAMTVAMGWDDPDLTVGKLMRLFRWFDQHTIDGNARGVTAALLDRLIGATGFVQAVADTGWLLIDSNGLTLHNFDRHNGATAKSRALTAKRVANHRGGADDNAASNAATVSAALAREEKKRKEKEKETSAPKAVAFDAATGHFQIPDLLMTQWRGAYPALSLDVELSKASAWLIANPKNAKSNYARFLTNWLSKAQDKAPRVANAGERKTFEGVV